MIGKTSSPSHTDGPPETARLTLEEMGPLGDTLARFQGETVNVFGGIPGEEVLARIVRYRRRRLSLVSAVVTEVLTPSPHRVEAPCGYFGACTGCQWQHIDYPHQLRLKRQAVEQELRSHPALEGVSAEPTMPCQELFNYRNHARFTVRREGRLGFVNRLTRRFVAIDECKLMAGWINQTLGKLQGRSEETTQLSIRYGVNTGDWLIQPTLQNPDIPVRSGQRHYREELMGHPFRIGSPSFFQTNTGQTERLIDLVRSHLHLSGDELLVDAYAGVGTFAVLMASSVGKVIAIEESTAAVRDAAINTLGIDNLEYIEGKTETVLGTLDSTPDALILDPPRVGCHPDTLRAVLQRPPGRVVYVSCDPATLARDLAILVEGGYAVDTVEPVDMFPQAYHVECVAALRHRA